MVMRKSRWGVHGNEEVALRCAGYSPESPPVMASVPLNSVGAPVCEYDMARRCVRREGGRRRGNGPESWMRASDIQTHQGEVGSPTADCGPWTAGFMGWSVLYYCYLSWSTGQHLRRNKRGASRTAARPPCEGRGVGVGYWSFVLVRRAWVTVRHGWRRLISPCALGEGAGAPDKVQRARWWPRRARWAGSPRRLNSSASCAADAPWPSRAVERSRTRSWLQPGRRAWRCGMRAHIGNCIASTRSGPIRLGWMQGASVQAA